MKTWLILIVSLVMIIACEAQPTAYFTSDTALLKEQFKIRKPDPTNEPDAGIVDFTAKVNRILGTKYQVQVADTGLIFSHPALGIVINTKEIDRKWSRYEHPEYNIVLLFTIAHEAVHQMQFSKVGFENMQQSTRTEKKQYELQADIMAGALLVMIAREDKSFISFENLREGLSEILIKDLSNDVFASSYPRLRDRLRGATKGTEYGEASLEPDARTAIHLQQKLWIQPNEDLFTWSSKIAKAIENDCRCASTQVQLLKETVTRSSNLLKGKHYADYELVYRNMGVDTVMMEMQVICHNTLDNYFQGSNHSQLLAPNATLTVSGRFELTGKPEQNEIVYPPNNLVQSSFFSTCCCNGEKAENIIFGIDQDSKPVADVYGFALNNIIELLRYDYRMTAEGPYRIDKLTGAKRFQSIYTFPGSEINEVHVRADSSLIFTCVMKEQEEPFEYFKYVCRRTEAALIHLGYIIKRENTGDNKKYFKASFYLKDVKIEPVIVYDNGAVELMIRVVR
jgi:hypothetical protein